ncbi:SDR family NAD(P)-dependent oxidoreductase [Palleronia sp. KMU-117]|uniref:SDR family NAD(P)-dependent oxidoreductase n=1 Tax=Palleronia sp. KMU-117 TaxID=3434108 RepID=UPI003D719605
MSKSIPSGFVTGHAGPPGGRRLLIVGGSRGIGASAAAHFVRQGDTVLAVSRRPAVAGAWVRADVARDDGIAAIADAAGDEALDALLFLGGTWEEGAFTDAFRFSASSSDEARHVVSVNLLAPILLARALAPALLRAANPRIVLMGAVSSKDNAATPEVANTASKFGLRGAAQALRLSLPRLGITVINPGNVATPEVEADIAEGRFGPQVPIPVEDVLAALDFVLGCSAATTVAEIDLLQRHPG